MWDWRQWDSHKQRLVTGALIALPLFLIISLAPYWAWCLLVALASLIGLWEAQGLLFSTQLTSRWQAFNLLTGLIFPAGAALAGANGLHSALVAALFLAFSSLLAFSPQDSSGVSRVCTLTLGWLYIPYLLSYVLLIGSLESAKGWIFFILIVTIAADAGAYYSGKKLGKHKLYEVVSPNKTIEGSIGGLTLSLIAGTLYGVIFLDGVPAAGFAALSVVLALISQIGDLIESMIKRLSGKKDSSQLLPGHGGLLDRLDSLLFLFPATWLFLVWMDIH